jgi:8-oxo-dGTP pyrophosphatase MutT (NUDIX family)
VCAAVGMSDYVKGLRAKVGHHLLFGPSAATVIKDGDRYLLVRHVEGSWTFPGGAVDPGETPGEAARRETREEAGVDVELLSIAGVYGGYPNFRGTYSNGDEVAWVTTLFEARIVDGEPHPADDETADVRWVTAEQAYVSPLSPSTRHMLERLEAGISFDP